MRTNARVFGSHGALREVGAVDDDGEEESATEAAGGNWLDCEEEYRDGEGEEAVGVALFDLKVYNVSDEGGDDEGCQQKECGGHASEGGVWHAPPRQINGDLKRYEEKKGFEKVDREEAVAEETYAEGYDERGQRHASGVEADGIAGGSHGFGASGKTVAMQQALSRWTYEVGELKQRRLRSGVIEEPDRSEACYD